MFEKLDADYRQFYKALGFLAVFMVVMVSGITVINQTAHYERSTQWADLTVEAEQPLQVGAAAQQDETPQG